SWLPTRSRSVLYSASPSRGPRIAGRDLPHSCAACHQSGSSEAVHAERPHFRVEFRIVVEGLGRERVERRAFAVFHLARAHELPPLGERARAHIANERDRAVLRQIADDASPSTARRRPAAVNEHHVAQRRDLQAIAAWPGDRLVVVWCVGRHHQSGLLRFGQRRISSATSMASLTLSRSQPAVLARSAHNSTRSAASASWPRRTKYGSAGPGLGRETARPGLFFVVLPPPIFCP